MKGWLTERFGDVMEGSGGKEWRVCCPFCRSRIGLEDTNYHLYVSKRKHVAHCFRCEWAGNYVSLIMSVDGCSYGKALLQIRQPIKDIGEFGDVENSLYSERGLVKADDLVRTPEGYQPLTFKHNLGCPEYVYEEQAIWRYLESERSVPRHIMTRSFGWIPGTQRAWCLVDNDWWQGRLIVPGKPKYISPPWPKGDSLWNAHALKRHKDIVICEGVFSAIAVGSDAVALCGKTINEEQAKRIVRNSPRSITVLLDADARKFIGDIVENLLLSGYGGDIKVQYMARGDPADGEFADVVDWCFDMEVTYKLSI